MLLVVHLLFSHLKKTAGWHVAHLCLQAMGRNREDEQVVDLSVWLWIRLRPDTR